MKSRVQMAGVAHGSKEKIIWNGDLPVISGVPGMRIVINHPSKDEVMAFSFKQMCLEINAETGEVEQVIYVLNVDKSIKLD